MIIEEYDENLFISRFEDFKRVINPKWKGGNFSYKGLRCLFEYLNELYDEENPLKLDVISLCCDYNEYENLSEYLKDYSNQHESLKEITGKENLKDLNKDELTELSEVIQNDLNEKTTLIKFGDDLNDGFIIQAY